MEDVLASENGMAAHTTEEVLQETLSGGDCSRVFLRL